MNILLTGSDGFIGRNFTKTLSAMGHTLVCVEKDECWEFMDNFRDWPDVDLVLHQGAISNTTERNIRKLFDNNVDFTLSLFETAMKFSIPVKFASSASVYGNLMTEVNPLNHYAISKLMVDMWIEDNKNNFPLIQSFRYFNVYGEGEEFKVTQGQASPISTFVDQVRRTGTVTLFEGSENFHRDFVCVRDVVSLVLNNDKGSGVWDLGTGKPISFQTVGDLISSKYNAKIRVVKFPEHLRDKYQIYTKAKPHFPNYNFITVEDYVENCLD